MTHSRIMNLKRGMTFCPVCGSQYSWNIQTCINCANKKIEADRAAAIAEALEREEKRRNWPQNQAIAVDEAAPLAEKMHSDYLAYLAEMTSEIETTPDDWRHMRRDLAL